MRATAGRRRLRRLQGKAAGDNYDAGCVGIPGVMPGTLLLGARQRRSDNDVYYLWVSFVKRNFLEYFIDWYSFGFLGVGK